MSVKPVESIKSSVREAANWFTRERAVIVASLGLAGVTGVVVTVGTLATDARDDRAATPLIRADGFRNLNGVGGTLGGGSVNVDSLSAGRCVFDNVLAKLTYRNDTVTGVGDYQITLVDDTNAGSTVANEGPVKPPTVTVQDLAGLRRAAPYLHC